MPGLTIGDTLPDLEVETTLNGVIRLHDYVGDSYTIIFSHPADFTPVCTTEMGAMAAYAPKFAEMGVKLLGLSCDDVQSHRDWIKDIEAYAACKVTYPIAADPDRKVIKQLNMVDPDEKDPSSGQPLPSRALHIIGPDKKIKLSFLYPASTGRNMDEVVRAVESLQLAAKAKHKIATPANWKSGEPVVISSSVSAQEAQQMFSQGYHTTPLPSTKNYLRFTNPQSAT
ncbi:1-Cys peroxiredoxin PER1 [Andrographis paniculata]|uniref:1-Cys peroxiredoxin PER1 n=1 Tax=Andrographis paniculata TaxID=175694 RepID=UPI0021E81D9A|nr:1-Cys peroxiredoxin PER1 [Andrographis paniculata]